MPISNKRTLMPRKTDISFPRKTNVRPTKVSVVKKTSIDRNGNRYEHVCLRWSNYFNSSDRPPIIPE